MIKLNLPVFDYQINRDGDRVAIFDGIRKKYLVLTPEEWVRQHFIHYMLSSLGYPRSLIRVEGGLTFNERQKRSDIVVYDRTGKPWMLVECKSPDIRISQRTVDQAATYNATLQAPYLVVTNGLTHHFFAVDWLAKQTRALDSMPSYE
jgi:hypothetical protein